MNRGKGLAMTETDTTTKGFICPNCSMQQLPGDICIRCGLVFAKYVPPVSVNAVNATVKNVQKTEHPDFLEASADDSGESESKVNVVNLIVLLLLIDSTMILLARVPGIFNVFASSMSFHQKAKFLYDLLTTLVMFVSVFGLYMRKEWARIAIIALLGLGLAEGLYMMTYTQYAVRDLERGLQEALPEAKRNNSMKLLACAVYSYFIYVLCSAKTKAQFER
jgi:hypothetical protein